MFIYVDRCSFKAFLTILFILFSVNVYAINGDPYLLERTVKTYQAQEEFARNKKVYVESVRKIRENAPIPDSVKQNAKNLVERSIAVDKPTAQKMGQSFLQRLKGVGKLTGPALVGTVAVQGLLEAVGWVMEDGTYVKYKPIDEDIPNCSSSIQYTVDDLDVGNKRACTVMGAGKIYCDAKISAGVYSKCTVTGFMSEYALYDYSWKNDSKVSSSSVKTKKIIVEEQESEKVVLTATLAGTAILGEGYSDPVDSTKNKEINKGIWTGVAGFYEHDPSGVGNELPDQMDDRAKKSKPTSDGKPAPFADPKYDDLSPENPPLENDRWWPQDGDEATGDITQDKDEDGNPTGDSSVSLQFPVFCTWASRMCQWADDWVTSDKTYKDHIKEEKTFWETIKGWFDWTKEEPTEPKEEPTKPEEEKDNDLLNQMQSVDFGGSSYCPQDIKVPVSFSGLGSSSLTISYQPFCALASQIRPMVIMLAWILGAYIVTGRNMKGGSES